MRKILLISIGLFMTNSLMAQINNSINIHPGVEINGSFAQRFPNQKVTSSILVNDMNNFLNLNQDFSFQKIKEYTANTGVTHTTYQQYYKGIKVNNAKVLIHSKNGFVLSANGKVMQNPTTEIDIVPTITATQAKERAIAYNNIIKPIHNCSPVLVINGLDEHPKLSYTLKVDGINKRRVLVMYKVTVNAQDGTVLDNYSLIANNDVEATADTYYSGLQTITTDSFVGGYRLRDNARKIETYNAENAQPIMDSTTGVLFDSVSDITNSTTFWGPQLNIAAIQIDNFSNNTQMLSSLGMGFSTSGISGNIIHIFIDKLTDTGYMNVADIPVQSTAMPPVSLPIIQSTQTIADTNNYKVTIRKDSVSINLSTAELETLGYDTAGIFSFIITDTSQGTHSWASGSNSGTYTISMQANPAVDAHWGIEKTHQYYVSHFNYIGYDNDTNTVLKNYYNGMLYMSGTQNNAAAIPPPFGSMVYGTGDGIDFRPFVSIDVTGHEYTHLITETNASLIYEGESGALNESFSDMMATAIEFYAKPDSANWTIGEGVSITMPYLRSLSDPKSPENFTIPNAPAQPDTYLGEYWVDTNNPTQANDNGGVHTNSGVGNKWFYLLANGGTGTNDNSYSYSITGLGLEIAANIAFNGFTQYLTATSTYNDAYTATLNAAADIYGETSNEYNTTKEAWKAVGIPNFTNNEVIILAKTINIYPNPTNGKFQINSKNNKPFTADIIDAKGMKVKSIIIHSGINNYNVDDLAKGIYYIQYRDINRKINTKLVVL